LRVVNIPSDLRYSADHQWVAVEGDLLRIGITDYAQDALGDIQFIELPAIGTAVTRGVALGEVESMKSVSEVSAPVDGVVVDVNSELSTSPGLVNSDPYGAGWVLVLQPHRTDAPDSLLDAASYKAMTEG
jgi:glycine cleavage system H protein